VSDWWKCECPKCHVVNYADTFTKAIVDIPHLKNCAYVVRGLIVTFDAKPVTPRDMANLKAKISPSGTYYIEPTGNS
jgi:NAD-dependent SIR2 family protein deacetylase